MTYANNCEAYTTGPVTTSNSDDGGGSILSITDPGGAINYSTAALRYGAAGVRTTYAAAQGTTRFQVSNGTNVTGRFAIYSAFKLSAVPTTLEAIVHIRNITPTNACLFQSFTDGRVQLANTTGSAVVASRSTNPILANHWYGVCLVCTKGTTTTDGTIGYRLYDLTDNSILFTYEASTLNAGTVDLLNGCYGRHTTASQVMTIDYDDVRGQPLASGYLTPPPPAPVAVVVDNLALITSTSGTGPFTISQTAGTTTTPTTIDNGAVSNTGMWSVAKHTSSTLTYKVTDSLAFDSNTVDVPPSNPPATTTWPKKPGGAPPGTSWS